MNYPKIGEDFAPRVSFGEALKELSDEYPNCFHWNTDRYEIVGKINNLNLLHKQDPRILPVWLCTESPIRKIVMKSGSGDRIS